jgi:hypothetical protein
LARGHARVVAHVDRHLRRAQRLHLEKTENPRRIRRRRKIVQKILEQDPEARAEIEGAGELRGKLVEARAGLRDVLDARGVVLGAVDAARIDACTDLDALVRWRRQAVVAASVAEALQ